MMIGQVFILVILDLIVRVVYAFQLSFRGHSLILSIWDNNRLRFYLLYLVMHDINLRLLFVSKIGYRKVFDENCLEQPIYARSMLWRAEKAEKAENITIRYNPFGTTKWFWFGSLTLNDPLLLGLLSFSGIRNLTFRSNEELTSPVSTYWLTCAFLSLYFAVYCSKIFCDESDVLPLERWSIKLSTKSSIIKWSSLLLIKTTYH